MAYEPLITKAQLEARLSRVLVQRIFDDNDDGVADNDPVTALIRDASSKVRGRLGPVYNPETLDENTVDEVIRITLDVATAYAAQRHPEIVQYDWEALMKQSDADLKMLRLGEANLGTNASPPEPAANHGGMVSSGNPNRPTPRRRFSDNWGDF
jgi:phage gp36-like protein